jgi:hypothetical protein
MHEFTGNHQGGFQHNTLTTDQMFCIHQIMKNMGVQWDSTLAIMDFSEISGSIMREVLYVILTEVP